jgi:hypothetical protein
MRFRSASRRVLAGTFLLLLSLFLLPQAWSAPSMEMITNTTSPTNSGPAGNGPTVANQVVTLRNNPDNPTGNTFSATSPAVTVTYALSDQQFTLNTGTESPTGTALSFGGAPSSTIMIGGSPIYDALNSISAGLIGNTYYTSTGGSPAGTGLDVTSAVSLNGGVELFSSSRALLDAGVPTNVRHYMGTMTLTFSQPVNNPVLHFIGMGARNTMSGVSIGYTQEYQVTTSGVSVTRLSGNAPFLVGSGTVNGITYGANEIYSSANSAFAPDASCVINSGACGSVRVNGTGLSSVSMRVYMRSNGNHTAWMANPGQHGGDQVLIGVSVDMPTITVNKALAAPGRFAAPDQFTMQIRNSGGTVINAAANSTTSGSGAVVTAGTGTTGATIVGTGVAYTLTEAAAAGANLDNYATSISCSNANTGSGTVLPSGSGRDFTITVLEAADSIVCTFTNRPAGSISIVKDAVANSPQDFSFVTTGNGLSNFSLDDDSDPTLSNSRVFPGLVPGTYTVTETSLAGWSLTGLTCVDPGNDSTVNLATGVATINLAAGDAVVCTYVNTSAIANLSITKTNTPASGPDDLSADTLVAGQTLYSIVVTNAGPGAADAAVVRDTAVSGLNCDGPVTCSVTAGAGVCPTVTAAALQSAAGISIPTLPANSSLTFTMACTVQ